MSSFNAVVFVSEQLNRLMVNTAQELTQRAINACADKYNFDAEEAIRFLGIRNITIERKEKANKEKGKKEKAKEKKPRFPLPYNGEFNENCCYALRQNSGLYTQCTGIRKGEAQFCKSCVKLMEKSNTELPEYGTIQDRNAVGIFEYVDPKGRKPVSYTKIMKKYKVSEEEVREEAGKFNIILDDNHFIVPTEEKKKGRRPKNEEKEPKVKGAKGRPKKTKVVLQIEGDDDETDLFSKLVEEANNEDESSEPSLSQSSENSSGSKKKSKLSDEEKEAIEAAKKAEKEAKKAEKEAKKAAEKAEREAKEAAEKAEKEAKKAAEKAEKEAKKAAEKAEKEAKKAAEKAEKEAKKKQPEPEEEEEEEEEENEILKKNIINGKEYIFSKSTGIMYDVDLVKEKGIKKVIGIVTNYKKKIMQLNDKNNEVKIVKYKGLNHAMSVKTGLVYNRENYINTGEQVVLGIWDEKNKTVKAINNEEESEEEYEEESEEEYEM